MSAPNGRANGSSAGIAAGDHDPEFGHAPAASQSSTFPSFTPEQVNRVCADLEVPFDPRVIEWRVTNTTKAGNLRGHVMPYADQRAYTDRLNQLFSPAGWTRKYRIYTSANFERSRDQKNIAKVFVTCELSISGFGAHSATGEEWADDDNAGTAAEAQAFKRSCSCFGLGRYLYYFEGIWVDLDDRKRPKTVPQLPQWATPDGWRSGLRPRSDSRCDASDLHSAKTRPSQQPPADQEKNIVLVRQVEAMAEPLGKALYRGLLRTIACVWKPAQIQETALLEKVLTHMQAAGRGFCRLDAALGIAGPEALGSVLQSLKLASLDKVDNLETLKKIVLEMERIAAMHAVIS